MVATVAQGVRQFNQQAHLLAIDCQNQYLVRCLSDIALSESSSAKLSPISKPFEATTYFPLTTLFDSPLLYLVRKQITVVVSRSKDGDMAPTSVVVLSIVLVHRFLVVF